MTSARDEIFSTIRRSLGVNGRELPRAQIVADRLARTPKGVIPERGQVEGDELVELFKLQAEAALATVAVVSEPREAPGAVAEYLRKHNLPATIRMGDDPRLCDLPWNGTTLDISADLDELARTPVTVVCAGAKAILDLPRTLEYLETRGVPVVGYGTNRFPAFWSRDSGLPVPIRLDTPEALAGLIHAKAVLGLEGGVLVANPVPEDAEIPVGEIAGHIGAALADADRQGIAGKAVTPFLLSRMMELTGGRSLATNIALVKNNAALAARLAVALRDAA